MRKIVLMAMLSLAITEYVGIPGIMRLHVVANSDSRQDQQIKLQVRDAVLDYLSDMEGFDDEQHAEAYVAEHLDDIEQVAEECLAAGGKSYGAKANTGVYDFPEKQYGDTVLPQGSYHALRITLGDGGGANWFCVLYPPLCYLEVQPTSEEWTQSDGIEYKSLIGEYLSK